MDKINWRSTTHWTVTALSGAATVPLACHMSPWALATGLLFAVNVIGFASHCKAESGYEGAAPLFSRRSTPPAP